MTSAQWFQLLATLLGGGAAGAVFTVFFTRYRNKRQPVEFQKEVIDIFKKNPEFPTLQAVVMLGDPSDSGPGQMINNLSVVRYAIRNAGNQDLAEFRFGITLEGTNSGLDVKTDTPDRHHVLEVLTPVGVGNRRTELDFCLKPFNRREEYRVSVYFSYADEPGPISLSTPHSNELVEVDTAKTVRRALLITDVAKGLFKILAGGFALFVFFKLDISRPLLEALRQFLK